MFAGGSRFTRRRITVLASASPRTASVVRRFSTRTIPSSSTFSLSSCRLAHSTSIRCARRGLVTSAQKRALNKQQLEASSTQPPSGSGASGGGISTKPADINNATTSGGGGSSLLFPLATFACVGIGGAYYMNLIPKEYLPGFLKENDKAELPKELKEVVLEVQDESSPEPSSKEANVEADAAQQSEVVEVEKQVEEVIENTVEIVEDEDSETAAEDKPIEHDPDGHRVHLEHLSGFFQKVQEGHNLQILQEAETAAAIAAEEEAEPTESPPADPLSALASATHAMNELVSSTSAATSQTLRAAHAALKNDLDQEYFKDLDKLNGEELKVRVVQLATEMADRTKWEAVRMKEFLAMKEKEVGEKYLEVLQKQRLEFENLLAQKLREQEDNITRQANAALQAKEESVQSLLQATSDAREQEKNEILASETKRLSMEFKAEFQQQLENQLAQAKENYKKELEGHTAKMEGLQNKLAMLESRLEVSRNYETGSQKAHRISAAALAVVSKLEVGEAAAVELAALKGAAGDKGVLASAIGMIPKVANDGIPTLSDLQATFDQTYKIGREAAFVPEGRPGLDGQLLGILFSKLTIPPSPETVHLSEDECTVADGILSLARKYVQSGDLEKAVEQLDKLKGQTAFVVKDWKSRAMDRVSTERALKVIKLECALLNNGFVGSE